MSSETDGISMTAPVHPHELDGQMRRSVENLSRRVALRAAVEGGGRDLILRVYLAGLYHGATIEQRRGRDAAVADRE